MRPFATASRDASPLHSDGACWRLLFKEIGAPRRAELHPSVQIGRVYAITDKDGKREVKTLLQGLTQPNGLAVKDGALYVFAIHRVLRYDNIEDKLDNPGEPVDLTDKFGLPPEIHHNWKYAAFGPDGKLYIQVVVLNRRRLLPARPIPQVPERLHDGQIKKSRQRDGTAGLPSK
jgi:glucose/arabinose dehydrogenase